MEPQYVQNEETLVQEIGGESVVYKDSDGEAFVLNEMSSEVFAACRSGVTLDELVKRCQDKHALSAEQAHLVICEALEGLLEAKVLAGPPPRPSLTLERREFLLTGLKAAFIPMVVSTTLGLSRSASAASAICRCGTGTHKTTTTGQGASHVAGTVGATGASCCEDYLQPANNLDGSCNGCVACLEGTSGVCSCRNDNGFCNVIQFGAGTKISEVCVPYKSTTKTLDPAAC